MKPPPSKTRLRPPFGVVVRTLSTAVQLLCFTFTPCLLVDILDSWTPRASGTTNALTAIAYGSGQFVAVGHGGTILTSPDGEVWTLRESGVSTNLHAITFAKEQYVVMAAGGAVLISSNGVNWVSHHTGTNFLPSAIAYGRGLCVSVGGSLVLTSAEGTNWTSQSLSPPLYGAGLNLSDVTFGNDQFVAVGGYFDTQYFVPRGAIYTSRDGTNWTIRGWALWPASCVAASSNLIVAVAFPEPSFSFVSTDGTNWTLHPLALGVVRDLTFAQGLFVAAGINQIVTSPNGSNWTVRAQDTNWVLNGVAFGCDSFVAVGDVGLILESDRLPPLRFVVTDGRLGFATNRFGFNITGPSGQAVLVEGSSNLVNWLPLGTNTLETNGWFWTDAESTNFPRRFYRTRSQ